VTGPSRASAQEVRIWGTSGVIPGVRALLLVSACLSACATQPTCDASLCVGCCDSDGICQAGTEALVCGAAGNLCIRCPQGDSCSAGTCVAGSGGGAGGGSGGGAGGATVTPGTRFATPETGWSVPNGGTAGYGFYEVSGGLWSTLDIDGDQKPDLVWTRPSDSSGTQPVFGGATSPHWKVFKNTGAGFSATETRWNVPNGGSVGSGFYEVNGGLWSTFDIDGDKKPDLVWTRPSDSSGTQPIFGGATSPHWRVYKNTGTGFGGETQWSVPNGGTVGYGFYEVNGGLWSTFDLDGDLRPDLVWTRPSDSSGTQPVFDYGTAPKWKVYKNVP
jgi:hypothetical protein